MTAKRKVALLLTLLLWNPVVLLLLTCSLTVAVLVPVAALSTAYFVAASTNLRLKVWAFNLCAVVSVGLHAELLFREFMADRSIPNLYELHGSYYFNRPRLNQEFRTSEFVSHYLTNLEGYRIPDLATPDDSVGRCDWLFIGDSFTQGAQVNFDELFTTQLFRSFPDKVILNAGISGAGLYDELNFFRDRADSLKPRVVFLQIGVFNDFFDVREHRATPQDWLMEHSELYRYFAYNVLSTDSLPLGRWTEPFFPTRQENVDRNILFREMSETKRADIEAFKRCITEWKHETDRVDAQLVLFLIPSKEQVSPALLAEVMGRYHITASELDLNAANRLFKATAQAVGVTAFDLTEDFKSAQEFPFFSHDEHLSASGHTLVATALTRRLQTHDGNLGSEVTHEVRYLSLANVHERYPTLQADGHLLFQSQSRDYYTICKIGTETPEGWPLRLSNDECLMKATEELVHPVLSADGRYLAYTEGYQESSETDVVVRDNVLAISWKVNAAGHYAAIPAFSHSGELMAFPTWTKGTADEANLALYNVRKQRVVCSLKDTAECWRPVFSPDDKRLYFIKKRGHFVVECVEIERTRDNEWRFGATTTLFSLPYDVWDIALSPSGRYMAFAGNKDGNWDLFLYNFTTHRVQQLTHTIGNEWDPAFGRTDVDLWFAGTFGLNDGLFYRRLNL